MSLSPIGEKVHELKYAVTKKDGSKASWEDTCGRVAYHIASAEEDESKMLQYLADFTKILIEQTFVPGGRILANAGTKVTNLMNCFVLDVEDSRVGIYDALGKAASIFSMGGGVGYNFSKVRAEGSAITTVQGGKASGPTRFMELFNNTADIISQSSRRGAQMGILNVDHPDIYKFIGSKSIPNIHNTFLLDSLRCSDRGHTRNTLLSTQLEHFNISVGMFDSFMHKVQEGDKESVRLLRAIARNAWLYGDPGMIFIDTINKNRFARYLGDITCTNPCAEVPLLPGEACNLASINLERFIDGQYFDFEYLKTITRLAVRFLDNVHTVNFIGIPEIDCMCKGTRRLGLGVMGFADVLAEAGVDYDSETAYVLAAKIAYTIRKTALEYSMELAEEKGAYSLFDADRVDWTIMDTYSLPHKPMRNIAVTAIAPTGTLALLAGVNGGIEPFFANNYARNITSGNRKMMERVSQGTKYGRVKTAHDIYWKDHLRMQATWQSHTCNAVSKTINLPTDATEEDVYNVFIEAWKYGCKGITIYRDKSREFQILEREE